MILMEKWQKFLQRAPAYSGVPSCQRETVTQITSPLWNSKSTFARSIRQ